MYIFTKTKYLWKFNRAVQPPAQLRKEFLDSLEMQPGDLLYVRRGEWWEKNEIGFTYPRGISSDTLTQLYQSAVAHEYAALGKVLVRQDHLSVARPIPKEVFESAEHSFSGYLSEDGSWKKA